jgi:hypothetical protein
MRTVYSLTRAAALAGCGPAAGPADTRSSPPPPPRSAGPLTSARAADIAEAALARRWGTGPPRILDESALADGSWALLVRRPWPATDLVAVVVDRGGRVGPDLAEDRFDWLTDPARAALRLAARRLDRGGLAIDRLAVDGPGALRAVVREEATGRQYQMVVDGYRVVELRRAD